MDVRASEKMAETMLTHATGWGLHGKSRAWISRKKKRSLMIDGGHRKAASMFTMFYMCYVSISDATYMCYTPTFFICVICLHVYVRG